MRAVVRARHTAADESAQAKGGKRQPEAVVIPTAFPLVTVALVAMIIGAVATAAEVVTLVFGKHGA